MEWGSYDEPLSMSHEPRGACSMAERSRPEEVRRKAVRSGPPRQNAPTELGRIS